MPGKNKRTVRATRERKKAAARLVPLEILYEIFQYLDQRDLIRCAQVCQLWKTAAYSPHFWTNLQLFCAKFDRLDYKTALSLKEREISAICLELNKVTADYAEDHTTSQSDILKGVGIAEAKTLILKAPINPPRRYYFYGYTDLPKNQHYKPEDFRSVVACPQITDSCENLKCLVLAGSINIYQHGFMQSLPFLKSLTHLWITNRPLHRNKCIGKIFTELPSLKDFEISLSISSNWTIGGSEYDILPNLERLVLHNTCSSVRILGNGRQDGDAEYTTQLFWDIHDKFPLIKHLGISINNYKYIKEHERGSLPAFSNLQSFCNIGRLCGGLLPNQSILVQLLPSNLVALDIAFMAGNLQGGPIVRETFSEQEIELITTRFPGLKVLKLKGYNPISEVTLIDILSKMDKLEILSIYMGSPHLNSLRE